MALMTPLKRFIASHKMAAGAACGAAIAMVTAAALVVVRPGTSNASSGPRGIPTTMAQIRAEARKDPKLAEIGLIRLQETERMAQLGHLKPLTAEQRAADLKWIQQQQAAHAQPTNQRAPANKSGIFPIAKSGAGPWPSCEFFGHNLYATPPAGSTGVQYLIYAGNVPPTKTCVDDPDAINVATAGYGGLFEQVLNGPSQISNKVVLVTSPIKSPLEVTSGSGSSVFLKSLSGQKITFNLITHKFSS